MRRQPFLPASVKSRQYHMSMAHACLSVLPALLRHALDSRAICPILIGPPFDFSHPHKTRTGSEQMIKKLLLVILGWLLIAASVSALELNSASQAELDALKGIGPVKSKAIVDERTKNGPFKDAD